MAQKQGQPRLAIRWVWVIKPAGERVWFYIVTMGWVILLSGIYFLHLGRVWH